MKKSLVILLVALASISLFVGCKKEPEVKTYKVGDTGPAGGVIVYVADSEQTSTYVDEAGKTVTYKWKYLEAAPDDLTVTEGDVEISKFAFGYYFNNGALSSVSSTSANIGAGRANTRALVNAMGSTASTTGTVCSTCRGAVTLSCTDCGGKGKLSEKTCTVCNGSKSVSTPCNNCNGSGSITQTNYCSACGARGCEACGYVGNFGSSTYPCSTCFQTGNVPSACTACNVTGKITLAEEETCTTCEGKGSTECSACKATRTGNYAAKLCDDYSVTKDGKVYDDWFLPSKDELNEIYKNKASISNLVYGENKSYYWSSTEGAGTNWDSWGHDFYDNDVNYGERGCTFYIRPVRAF